MPAGEGPGPVEPAPRPGGVRGRVRRLTVRAQAVRDAVVASRPQHRSLDLAMTAAEHDVETGGALLAGALAFRLFLWLLPAALLLMGVLGFHPSDAAARATELGFSRFAATLVEHTASDAHRSAWAASVVGAVLLFGFSLSLAKTMHVAMALTWRMPVRRMRRQILAATTTIALSAAALGVALASVWLREQAPSAGPALVVLLGVVWAALWWLATTLLPHPADAPWWVLLPGAVLIGVGAQVMHLVTEYYVAPQFEESSSLYGWLGAAATVLLWTFLLARLMLASVVLDVIVLMAFGPPRRTTPSSEAGRPAR